jgi:hypothetical protein
VALNVFETRVFTCSRETVFTCSKTEFEWRNRVLTKSLRANQGPSGNHYRLSLSNMTYLGVFFGDRDF